MLNPSYLCGKLGDLAIAGDCSILLGKRYLLLPPARAAVALHVLHMHALWSIGSSDPRKVRTQQAAHAWKMTDRPHALIYLCA